MSNNHGVQSTSPSRRSVVKGAAWAVPAVVVAGAAPTVAASNGPLEFTGGACKLPGNATDILKGYVFELTANNTTGPLPTIGITVISNVKINGVAVTGFNASVRTGPACSGTCATTTCGATAAHAFCTPDGAQQQVLVYTADKPTGNSQNAEMSLSYQRFDCFSGACTPIDLAPVSITSGLHSTPPAPGPGQGSCTVSNVFPIPTFD